ncbi:hypothetical protein Tco_0244527, partial [Tanacetum coccineum]
VGLGGRRRRSTFADVAALFDAMA